MRTAYEREDGRTIAPRAWIETDKGVGQFSGTWENPTLGPMASLNYYRSFEKPDEIDTLFLMLPQCAEVLERAFIVAGPMTRTGRRPRRIATLRVVGGTAA